MRLAGRSPLTLLQEISGVGLEGDTMKARQDKLSFRGEVFRLGEG